MEDKIKHKKNGKKDKTIREIIISIQKDDYAMKEIRQLVKCPL